MYAEIRHSNYSQILKDLIKQFTNMLTGMSCAHTHMFDALTLTEKNIILYSHVIAVHVVIFYSKTDDHVQQK